MKETSTTLATDTFMTPAQLLKHWQLHRNLTRKMINTFPEDKIFSYSVGGMRPFAELAMEFIGMAVPTLTGIITEKWEQFKHEEAPATKQDLLDLWDEQTEIIDTLWPKISAERFNDVVLAFGQWEMPVYLLVLYVVDNEIHHRGQGYVYLRSLGIEPPAFWDRE
ncbi:DinB family protein [Chitinophaga silvisoli]|uniref:Damage-inducible protein DinB n=1 Tax=Chitinophaga silvisoli TaxID=2291814 RepID=A0A3E1NXH4_9BACT|nr:DinB family protein [Chitinophaga silvisoli]RFM32620.1 damage-inducible protein DinB [Chitinophaga silvisoli]